VTSCLYLPDEPGETLGEPPQHEKSCPQFFRACVARGLLFVAGIDRIEKVEETVGVFFDTQFA